MSRVIYIAVILSTLFKVAKIEAQDLNSESVKIINKSIEYIIEGNEYIGVEDNLRYKENLHEGVFSIAAKRVGDESKGISGGDINKEFYDKLADNMGFDIVDIKEMRECIRKEEAIEKKIPPGRHLTGDPPTVVFLPGIPEISGETAQISVGWIAQYENQNSTSNNAVELKLEKNSEGEWEVVETLSLRRR